MKKTANNTELDDKKMAIKVELKGKIEDTQKMLIVAASQHGINSRVVQSFCDDIENYKRILTALEDVKL